MWLWVEQRPLLLSFHWSVITDVVFAFYPKLPKREMLDSFIRSMILRFILIVNLSDPLPTCPLTPFNAETITKVSGYISDKIDPASDSLGVAGQTKRLGIS